VWLGNPHITLFEIADKLGRRIGREVTVQAVKTELEKMGLDRVSGEKIAEIAERGN